MRRNTQRVLRRLRPYALVRIIVPSRNRFGQPLATVPLLQRLAEDGLAEIGGGATSLSGEGVYRNGSPACVREPVIVVETYLPARITRGQRTAFARLIEELAARADQEALAVAVGGRLHLIPSSVGGGQPDRQRNRGATPARNRR